MIKYEINYLFKPETPVKPESIVSILEKKNFSENLTQKDRSLINYFWKELKKKNNKIFSRKRGLNIQFGELKNGQFKPKLI